MLIKSNDKILNTVYAISDASFCPLGNTSEDLLNAVLKNEDSFSKVNYNNNEEVVSKLNKEQIEILNNSFSAEQYTQFEQMCLLVVKKALTNISVDIQSEDCIIILSTTKGNIGLLNDKSDERISISASASLIADYFRNPNKPIIVSNACISGSLALITGKRLLGNSRYKHAIVVGCDCLSDFIISGFQSFHALASEPCKPFDKDRSGLNLGEAAACIVLSTEQPESNLAYSILAGGATSNDANHLSGPSKTGLELAKAISVAIQESALLPEEISLISAHGTATNYNDEMEAKALALSGVNYAPLHSLKSYIGHTLGAAGIIESIIANKCMQNGTFISSLGYETTGVSVDINPTKISFKGEITSFLKTASGFGGCNAALVFKSI